MAETLADDPAASVAVSRDIAAEGAATVRALVTVALDAEARPEVRAAAVELLPKSGVGAAAHALVHVAKFAPEPWLRRNASWRVRETAELPGSDGVLLALILRQKYETDDEARVWLASSLAAFGVDAGVEDLVRLAADMSVKTAAASELARLVEAAGVVSGEALVAAWRASAPTRAEVGQLPAALSGAVWRAVSELSGEHFQLRGVDDARYALSRLPGWAALELALALEDQDPFVRLHIAQVLERMGPRGREFAARPLIARLDDPHDGVAAAVAEALGAVVTGAGADPLAEAARDALTARIGRGVAHELRVAAVRGLGRLLDPAALPALETLAANAAEPQDVRMAAAEGVLALADGDGLLAYLAAQLDEPLGDAGAAEALLGRWLEGAAPESAAHSAAASLWRALAPPYERVHSSEEVKARRRARGALIAPFVDG